MLGDLIAQACACGARVEVAQLRAWSDEFDDWYVPRYLVLGDRHVPLPTIDDDGYLLDVPIVEFITTRLGLEMEVRGNGWRPITTLKVPNRRLDP